MDIIKKKLEKIEKKGYLVSLFQACIVNHPMYAYIVRV